MDAREIARRPSALPSRFATRVPPDTLEGLRLMEEGREYGELTVELAATLAHTRAIVTPAEQRELRELLAATDMPAWAGGQDPRTTGCFVLARQAGRRRVACCDRPRHYLGLSQLGKLILE